MHKIIQSLGLIICIVYFFKTIINYINYKKKKVSNTTESNNFKILRDITKIVFIKGKTIKDACDIIINILRHYYPIDYITIFEYNSGLNKIEIISTNIDKCYICDIEIYANEVFAQMDANSEGNLYVGETADTLLKYPSAGKGERQINYMFMIPLVTTESVIGAFMIEIKTNSGTVHKKDKNIVKGIVRKLPGSIKNNIIKKSFETPNTQLDEELFRVISNNIAIVLDNFKYNHKIATLATIDGLTDVFNRHYMESLLDNEISIHKEKGTKFSITILDIDKFKIFNDTHGHLFGDYVLKQTAATLKSFSSRGCIVNRYGGEEFVVYIPYGDIEEVLSTVEEMRMKISEMELEKDDRTKVRVTASFGIASYPQDATDKEALLENSDKALYYSKETGRNKVTHFSYLTENDYRTFVSIRNKCKNYSLSNNS